MVDADGVLQQSTTCKSRLNVLVFLSASQRVCSLSSSVLCVASSDVSLDMCDWRVAISDSRAMP